MQQCHLEFFLSSAIIMDSLETTFWVIGLNYANRNADSMSQTTSYRIFRSFYGIGPDSMASLWRILSISGEAPKHLVWTLFFLKRYNTEHVNASVMGCDEKTFREHTWRIIEALSRLPLVSKTFSYFFLK